MTFVKRAIFIILFINIGREAAGDVEYKLIK